MTIDYDKHKGIALGMLDAGDDLGGINTLDQALAAAQVHATLALAAATLTAASTALVEAAVQLDGVALQAQERIQELRQGGNTSEAKTSRICGMDEVAGIAREQARFLRHTAGVDDVVGG